MSTPDRPADFDHHAISAGSRHGLGPPSVVGHPPAPRKRWRRFGLLGFARLSALVGLGFLLMVPFSYSRYTSVGIDTDQLVADGVLHDSYRLRWPGDGTVRLQYDRRLYEFGEERMETVDFAARVLERPPRTRAASTVAWHGFSWGVQQRGERKSYTWIGSPSWLPALLLMMPWSCSWRFRMYTIAGATSLTTRRPED